MADINFVSFLTLAVISLFAALVVHYAISYRFLEGFDGFVGKWILGWIAAWLGSPVLGHWFAGGEIGSVYIIPALIAGFVGAFLPAAIFKARAGAMHRTPVEVHGTQQAA